MAYEYSLKTVNGVIQNASLTQLSKTMQQDHLMLIDR